MMLPAASYACMCAFAGLAICSQGRAVEEIATGIGRLNFHARDGLIVFIRNLPGNDEAYCSPGALRGTSHPDTYDMATDGSAPKVEWETVLRGILSHASFAGQQGTRGLMSDADVASRHRLFPIHTHVKFRALGHASLFSSWNPVSGQ